LSRGADVWFEDASLTLIEATCDVSARPPTKRLRCAGGRGPAQGSGDQRAGWPWG